MALNNVGSYQPSLQNAVNLTNTAGQAIPFSPLTGSDINQYMNPYMGQVIGGLESAANTNLFQNILPRVQDQFVSAGQSRSPQEMQAANNMVYQSNQALDQAIAGALGTGYQGALQTAQQQQATGLQTAAQNRAAAQTAGAQFGQLGALQQQLGAADVGQVAAAGQAQDITNQANINAALNNFYAQQQWPYQNLAFASNIIRGQAVPSNTQTVGLQYNPGQAYTPSPLASFVGTTLGASALGNTSTGLGANQSLGALGLRNGGRIDRGTLQRAALAGRGYDTEIAHISPREGALLQRLGGSGTRNPRTGLREFDDSGASASSPSGLVSRPYTYSGTPVGGALPTTGVFAPTAFTGAVPGYDISSLVSSPNIGDYATVQPGAQIPQYALDAYNAAVSQNPSAAPQLISFKSSGQPAYGMLQGAGPYDQTPGYYGIPVPTDYANTPWDPSGLKLAPAVPGSGNDQTGAQNWSYSPTGAVPTQSNINDAVKLGQEIKAGNKIGMLPFLALGAPLAIGGLAGALGAVPGALGAAQGVADLGTSSTGLGALTPDVTGGGGLATGATAPAAASSGGALSSLFNSPEVQALKLASNLSNLVTPSGQGQGGVIAATAQPAAAATPAVVPQTVYSGAVNPAFAAAPPSASFYARRGGRVPGALQLRRAA